LDGGSFTSSKALQNLALKPWKAKNSWLIKERMISYNLKRPANG